MTKRKYGNCLCKTAQEHYRNMKEDYDFQVRNDFPLEEQSVTYQQLVIARETFERELKEIAELLD